MADSPPQVNAFVLCDQAFQQAVTGKWCIIGTFGVIWARAFPWNHAPFVLFVGLSDFRGPAQVTVSIRGPEGQIVRQVQAQLPEMPVPMAEFGLPAHPVRFDAPGSYTAELEVGGQLLTARAFRVEQAPAQQNPFGNQAPNDPGGPGNQPPPGPAQS